MKKIIRLKLGIIIVLILLIAFFSYKYYELRQENKLSLSPYFGGGQGDPRTGIGVGDRGLTKYDNGSSIIHSNESRK